MTFNVFLWGGYPDSSTLDNFRDYVDPYIWFYADDGLALNCEVNNIIYDGYGIDL